MSKSTIPNVVKRESRFDLGKATRAVVHRTDGSTLFGVSGTLLSASPDSVQVCLENCIPDGKTVSLHIFFDDASGNPDGEIVLDAEVAWTRPAGKGKWITGCECEGTLPDDVFAMFAERGQNERRREERRPTQLEAMVRWDSNLGELPIEISDASRRGFALHAAKMGAAGDHLAVRFNSIHGDEVTVAARLQWKARTATGYLGGCLLMSEQDHRHLMSFVVDASSYTSAYVARTNRRKRNKKKTQARFSAAFAATIFLLLVGPPLVVLPLLRANRAQTSTASQPYEATTESRLALVDVELPTELDSLQKTVHQPAPTGTQLPLDEPSVETTTDTALLESGSTHGADQTKEAPAVDETPAEAVAQVPKQQDTDDTDRTDQFETPEQNTPAQSPTVNQTQAEPSLIAQPDITEPGITEPGITEPGIVESGVVEPAPAVKAVSPERGEKAFARGRSVLDGDRADLAIAAFAEAADAMPDVALYQYHWALALHLDGQSQAADSRVIEAARLEREHGLANWGQVMSRIQGRPRLWLERARRKALSVK